ncbi:hypothetical protein BH11MYX3_BH11MYX3_30620 [soil metagenome]
MAAPNAYDAVVEQAVDALRRLADDPPASEAARAELAELRAEWRRRPFTVGLAGQVGSRTDLIDRLCGGGMFERDGRVPGCAAIRVRRGPVTKFRAVSSDGSAEELSLPALPAAPVTAPRSHAEITREEVAGRQAVAERADAAVPRLVRVPPPRWAFWLWLLRWWYLLTARAAIAARERAHREYARSRRELAAAVDEVSTVVSTLPDARDEFFTRLSVLSSGMLAGRDVRTLEIDVADGPLPADVEVIETVTDDEVDELVTLSGDEVPLAGTTRRIGTIPELIASLGTLPYERRAIQLVRRASAVVAAEVGRLDDLIAHAEIERRNRIASLENLRLHDPTGFSQAQLARASGPLGSSIHAVLEHAGVHLSSELVQCATTWVELVDAAQNPDELKAAAAKIDDQLTAATRRIGEETRLLVVGGVGGCAYDLLLELFAPLRDPALPDEYTQPPRTVPALPPVEMLPSLNAPSTSRFADELAGAGKWLAGLFRSIDARRAELRTKVEHRASHLREVAEAEMLDAEPRLREALRETLARELSAAVERRSAWVARQLAQEQLAVDAERSAVRPLADAVEQARRDARGLAATVAEHA